MEVSKVKGTFKSHTSCEFIADAISDETGINISRTTVRRLCGVDQPEKPLNPSEDIKQALCMYLEYDSWNNLLHDLQTSDLKTIIINLPKNNPTTILSPNEDKSIMNSLRDGDYFWIRYRPNRMLELKILDKKANLYKVNNKAHIESIELNDILTIPILERNVQFYVLDVNRNNVSMGKLKSGTSHVITKIARTWEEINED